MLPSYYVTMLLSLKNSYYKLSCHVCVTLKKIKTTLTSLRTVRSNKSQNVLKMWNT